MKTPSGESPPPPSGLKNEVLGRVQVPKMRSQGGKNEVLGRYQAPSAIFKKDGAPRSHFLERCNLIFDGILIHFSDVFFVFFWGAEF